MKYGMNGDRLRRGFCSVFFETIFVLNSLVAPRCTLVGRSAATRLVGNLSMILESSADLKTVPVKRACATQLTSRSRGRNFGWLWSQSGGHCLTLAAVTQS